MNFHDVFGRTGQLANIDIFLTVLFGAIVSIYFKLQQQKAIAFFVYLFGSAEILHWIFGVKTPVLKFLGF